MSPRAEILEPTEDSILKAASSLRNGDVVALPTETVYGLAAIISSDSALREIFSVKERPSIDPLIVHVLNLSALMQLVDADDCTFNKLRNLTDAFSPGPLTFILKKKKSVSDIISAGKKTVAIRIPAHPVFREVLRIVGPLAAPSANPFGYISPTRPEHVLSSIGDKISYILDGGPCEVGLESTILDLSGKRCSILRPGAVTAEMVSEILGEKIELYHPAANASPSAPGMLMQHYSPKTRLCLFQKIGDSIELCDSYSGDFKIGGKTAIIYLSRQEINDFAEMPRENVFWLSENGALEDIARNVFDLLQRLDCMDFDVIYCQVPEKIGIGVAIHDRLGRAAAKFKV